MRSLHAVLFAALSAIALAATDIVGADPVNGPISAQFTSRGYAFDGPYLSAVNSTSFEWWYFDAVSADLAYAITVIFFTAGSGGFEFLEGVPGDVSVNVNIKLPNGTVISTIVPTDRAIITTQGHLENSINGTWDGVGSFLSTSDFHNHYDFSLRFDIPDFGGISGSLSLKSTTRAHNPCSPSLKAGEDLHVMPHIGWVNPIADSVPSATISFANGTSYEFHNGSGYHDHNWGDVPFLQVVNGWYWGHVQLGPWSIVFFTGNDTSGDSLAVADLYRHGQTIEASCNVSSITATPTNGPGGDGDLEVLHISIPVAESGQSLELDIAAAHTLSAVPGVYYRWTASVTGRLTGGESYAGGVSIVEHFVPVTT